MNTELRHLISDAPRVMVVDGSKLVRKLVGDVLVKELPNVEVVACSGLAEAQAALATGPFHLVTTSLALPAPPFEPLTVKQVGETLMTNYVWPLQCVGLLLTAALIGALVLVMEEKR